MIRGAFDRVVSVQRGTPVTDDYGGETLTWIEAQKARARVRFGMAQEQRQAAQETGQQTATFEMKPTAALLATNIKDRIVFDGENWDITEVAPLDRHTIRFTAVRSA